MVHRLDFYTVQDLDFIIKRSAEILGASITPEGAREIATRCRGTPRIANRLLRRVRDWAQVKSHDKIDPNIVAQALESHDIDPAGLDSLDRKMLRALIGSYGGGPAGVDALAATLNEEVDTLVDVVEPYLLKSGFLKRTSRGREATPLAYKHLKLSRESLF